MASSRANTPEKVAFGDSIRDGDMRGQLVALRDLLADRLEAIASGERVSGPDPTAAIAAQLRQVLVDLNDLPLNGEESDVDDLARARAARRSKAAAS